MKTLSIALLFIIGLLFVQLAPTAWNTENSKLTDFTVYGHDDHIKITWSTLSRNEIASYEIQRSRDSKRFETFKVIDGGVDEPKAMEYFEVDYEPYLGWSICPTSTTRKSYSFYEITKVKRFISAKG